MTSPTNNEQQPTSPTPISSAKNHVEGFSEDEGESTDTDEDDVEDDVEDVVVSDEDVAAADSSSSSSSIRSFHANNHNNNDDSNDNDSNNVLGQDHAKSLSSSSAIVPSGSKGVMRIKLSLSRKKKTMLSASISTPSAMRGAALPLGLKRKAEDMVPSKSSSSGAIDDKVGLFSKPSPTIVSSAGVQKPIPISGEGIAPNSLSLMMMGAQTGSSSNHIGSANSTTTTISPVHAALMNISDISQVQPIKMPSNLVSPGLLLPPTPLQTPSMIYQQAIAKAFGNDTPTKPSDQAAEPDLSTEHRGMFRGSSIRREVSDMFDSAVMVFDTEEVDVSLLGAIDFYEALIPKQLAEKKVLITRDEQCNGEISTNAAECTASNEIIHHKEESLLSAVVNALEHVLENSEAKDVKKPKSLSFAEMVPTSLTTEYPPDFISKYKKYMKDVQSREVEILHAQRTKDCLDDSLEIYDNELKQWNDKMLEHPKDPPPRPIRPHISSKIPLIPPIPDPPTPPKQEPVDKKFESLIKHLDPKLFRPSCRYYGLASNSLTDPQFVGPCAPGIAALTGGSSSNNLTNIPPISCGSTASKERRDTQHKSTSVSKIGDGKTSKIKSNKKKTASALKSQELRTIFENNEKDVPKLRDSMIRAAIACFSDGNGDGRTPWIASNGETYPDIGKVSIIYYMFYMFSYSSPHFYFTQSFSAFSNVKPCTRCRSNKQGAYHCRLRRKHKDPDWDGLGCSTLLLGPYMEEYRNAPLLRTVPDTSENLPEAIAEAFVDDSD